MAASLADTIMQGHNIIAIPKGVLDGTQLRCPPSGELCKDRAYSSGHRSTDPLMENHHASLSRHPTGMLLHRQNGYESALRSQPWGTPSATPTARSAHLDHQHSIGGHEARVHDLPPRDASLDHRMYLSRQRQQVLHLLHHTRQA